MNEIKAKKILFLNHNQKNFGTYYRCLFLAKGLSRRGYKITMICASGKNFDLLIGRKKINDNFEIITLPRIKYHKYFTGQILFRLPITLLFVIFGNYDICHAFTVAQPQIGIPAWVAKKIRGKKLIVDWDDAWGGGFAEHHPWPIRKILTFFENGIPGLADHVTYVSEFIGKKLDDLGIRQKTKIPNGCNTEQIKNLSKADCRNKLKIEQGRKIIISVGNTYMDCLEIFFKAFQLAIEKEPGIFLYMVGEVDIPEKLKKIYGEIKSNIVLTGKRPFSEIPFFLGAADALVLPMSNEAIELARFPMRFGDYLCAGRPIISNAVGEVKHYMEKYDCGLTSDPKDWKNFGENIALFVSKNPERYNKNCTALAFGGLGWDEIVKKLDSIYKNI